MTHLASSLLPLLHSQPIQSNPSTNYKSSESRADMSDSKEMVVILTGASRGMSPNIFFPSSSQIIHRNRIFKFLLISNRIHVPPSQTASMPLSTLPALCSQCLLILTPPRHRPRNRAPPPLPLPQSTPHLAHALRPRRPTLPVRLRACRGARGRRVGSQVSHEGGAISARSVGEAGCVGAESRDVGAV
jgi:hypothetical protein